MFDQINVQIRGKDLLKSLRHLIEQPKEQWVDLWRENVMVKLPLPLDKLQKLLTEILEIVERGQLLNCRYSPLLDTKLLEIYEILTLWDGLSKILLSQLLIKWDSKGNHNLTEAQRNELSFDYIYKVIPSLAKIKSDEDIDKQFRTSLEILEKLFTPIEFLKDLKPLIGPA